MQLVIFGKINIEGKWYDSSIFYTFRKFRIIRNNRNNSRNSCRKYNILFRLYILAEEKDYKISNCNNTRLIVYRYNYVAIPKRDRQFIINLNHLFFNPPKYSSKFAKSSLLID